jgi:hypothetical protein
VLICAVTTEKYIFSNGDFRGIIGRYATYTLAVFLAFFGLLAAIGRLLEANTLFRGRPRLDGNTLL